MSKPWETDLSVYIDEPALLDGLRRGDRFACSCLLKWYAPRFYRLSLQLVGDPDEAEDVLQEAFIRSCDRIDQFAGASSLGTWLHRIVVNTALMHLRRRGRDAVILPDSEPDQPEPVIEGLIDRESEPGGEVLSRELVERIEHAVLALPDSLRAAFVLRDLEGLSTREAAMALGISESALKVRLHRAHLALRAGLAPYLHEAPAAGETEEVDR
jgi:RNA polymerase sigma-70 factor (ECF subfamily)